MTDPLAPTSEPSAAQPPAPPARQRLGIAAVGSWTLRGIAALSLLVAIIAEVPATSINYSQWRNASAVAHNAETQQRAEAEGKRAEAQKQLADARNAAARTKAEAAEAEADASRLEQLATTKQNEAANAVSKAKAEADATVNQAELLRQQGLTELANAQAAATQMKIDADQSEQDVTQARYNLRRTVYSFGIIRCPGTSYIAKINAAYDQNGRCAQ